MTERAGARDGQNQPDPTHFKKFCQVVVPGILTDVCHVDEKLAARVGEDILARGESYAALDDTTRDVLMSPFAEEVVDYEPADASLTLKGAVAVVVRNSQLEELHSRGPVDAGSIRFITTMAAGPMSHLLAAQRGNPAKVKHNLFAGLAAAHPRAWACLSAVVLAFGAGGGRWPYRFTAAPIPELPAAEVEAPGAGDREYAVVLSGADARFDQRLVEHLHELAEHHGVFVTASLSRISRHMGKLLQVMEYLLAHDASLLTANYLLRTNDVWVRCGELIPADRDNLFAAWRVSRGLTGAHRATVAKIVEQLAAEQSADGE